MPLPKYVLILLLIALLSVSGCSSQRPLPELKPQWLVANDLTITEQTQDLSTEQTAITLQTLTISGLRDRRTERSINERLASEAEALLAAPLPAYHGLLRQLPPDSKLREQTVSASVIGDFNHLLSVVFYRTQLYRSPNGHDQLSVTDIRTLTFDLHTGRVLTLAELFPADCDYLSLLDQLTQQVIAAHPYEPDSFSYQLAAPFSGVTDDWHFSITPYGLRLYLDEQTPDFLLPSPRPQTIDLLNAALDGTGYFAGTVYDASHNPLTKTCQPYRILRSLSPSDYLISQTTEDLLPGCSSEIIFYDAADWPPVIRQAITQAAQPDDSMLASIRANIAAGKHQHYLGSGGARRLGPYYIVSISKRSDEYVGWVDAGPDEISHYTQTLYDAQTLQVITLPELFVPGYDYQSAFLRSLQAAMPELDEQTAQTLLEDAQVTLEDAGLRLNIDPRRSPGPAYIFIPYRELGEENLICFQ